MCALYNPTTPRRLVTPPLCSQVSLSFTTPLQLKSRRQAGDKDSWLMAVPTQCMKQTARSFWDDAGGLLTWNFAAVVVQALNQPTTKILSTAACTISVTCPHPTYRPTSTDPVHTRRLQGGLQGHLVRGLLRTRQRLLVRCPHWPQHRHPSRSGRRGQHQFRERTR